MKKPNIKTTLQIIDSPEAEEIDEYRSLHWYAESNKEEREAIRMIDKWKEEKNLKWISLESLKYILDDFFKYADVDGRQISFLCHDNDIRDLYEELNIPLNWDDLKR